MIVESDLSEYSKNECIELYINYNNWWIIHGKIGENVHYLISSAK